MLGNLRDLNGEIQVVRGKIPGQFIQHGPVVRREGSFSTAMRRSIEEIERGMSHKFRMSDPLEHGHRSAIDLRLSEPARVLVSRKEDLRRQVKLKFVVPFELCLELALKPTARPEPHDFVLDEFVQYLDRL
jgi:hypothetical protein